MEIKNKSFVLIPLSLILFCSPFFAPASSVTGIQKPPFWLVAGGRWELLQPSVGVSAMHMQLLNNNKVVMFDRTDFGASNLSLPDGKCRYNDQRLSPDCTAHSLLYDILSNTFRPLMVLTDTWCSSGSLIPNGTLVQTGGYLAGDHIIRSFTACNNDSCDWVELEDARLTDRRWYASNQILPDGQVIVVGGRRAFTYEFFPKNSSNETSFFLQFLWDTNDPGEENNLYPFLHLLPDGNLFVFANKRSILLDYHRNVVVREFPVMPGADKRNYPSTGSSVLLPLRLLGRNLGQINNETANSPPSPVAEVMICGGAPNGAFDMADKLQPPLFVDAARTCGRLRVSDPDPEWVMELMPMPRVMSDMILLPNGDILIINGASNGTAGWENAINPVLNPVLYMPHVEDPRRRFAVLSPSRIARMYHSAATLLPDGRILVGGSNPHVTYNFTANPYPTELSLEAFHPPYLDPRFAALRPSVLSVESDETVSYGHSFSLTFTLPVYRPEGGVSVALVAPAFVTHSFGMNQRVVVLNPVRLERLSMLAYKVLVEGPMDACVAPPGYYMVFVVHVGVPSYGVWVKVV